MSPKYRPYRPKKVQPQFKLPEELEQKWQLTRSKVLDAFATGNPLLKKLVWQLNQDRNACNHLGYRGPWSMPKLRAIIWDAQGIAPLPPLH